MALTFHRIPITIPDSKRIISNSSSLSEATTIRRSIALRSRNRRTGQTTNPDLAKRTICLNLLLKKLRRWKIS
jgi:hypothetical protein